MTIAAPDIARPDRVGDVLLGRQPIFDRQLHVVGYELLFRHDADRDHGLDGSDATSQVVVNAFTEFGIASVVADKRAFINAPREFLLSDAPLLLPTDLVVLEVLEDTAVDDLLLDRIGELVALGYSFALDDYVSDPRWESVLPIVDIVKVDVPQLDATELADHLELLRGAGVTVLAEKVETEAQFEMLRELGYDLFQGFFLARPKILDRPRIPASRLNVVRLVAMLQDESIGYRELERLIESDVGLSYRLFRYLGSASFGLPVVIRSVRQALVYLGTAELRRWTSLLALSNLDDRPVELFRTALIRGQLCERMARSSGASDPEAYFTLGLLSTLESLLQAPIERILADVALAPEIRAALVDCSGPMGETLDIALAAERGEPSHEDVAQWYVEALAWADSHVRSL